MLEPDGLIQGNSILVSETPVKLSIMTRIKNELTKRMSPIIPQVMVERAWESFLSSAPAVIQETAPNMIIIKVTNPPAPRAILMRFSMMLVTSHRRGGRATVDCADMGSI